MSNLDLRTVELKRNAWEAKARGRLQTKAKREMAANSLLRRNITTTIRRMVTATHWPTIFIAESTCDEFLANSSCFFFVRAPSGIFAQLLNARGCSVIVLVFLSSPHTPCLCFYRLSLRCPSCLCMLYTREHMQSLVASLSCWQHKHYNTTTTTTTRCSDKNAPLFFRS